MLQIITDLLGSMITAWILFYAVFKFSGNKINYKSKKFWLCLIGYAIYMIFSYKVTESFLKVIFNYIVLIILSYLYQKKSIIKLVLSGFLSYFILFISESIFVAISMFILKVDIMELKESIFTSVTTNLLIASIMFLLTNIINTKRLFKELIEQIYIKKNKIIIALFLVTILSFSIMLYSIYFDISASYALFLNVILMIIYAVLVINVLSQNNKNEKLQHDYDLKLNELSDYEKALIQKRKILHNRDNDLISIRGMIKYKKENKKAIDYINNVLKESDDSDNLVLNKVGFIPEGGLQGLIHKKIDLMKKKGIEVYLQVDDKLNELNFDKFSTQKNKNICTIVGIFLDNALEASDLALKKNVSIILTTEKNKLIINISNTYSGVIDASKIDEAGYSTKGKNRGFGLEMVKNIIEESSYLKNERQITGSIFNQKLIVKTK